MNGLREAQANKLFNELTTSKHAQSVNFSIVEPQTPAQRKNISSIYGGYTMFKKNNFIKYHTLINQYKNNFIIYTVDKDDKGLKLPEEDLKLLYNYINKLYTDRRAGTHKIKIDTVNALGGYKNFNNNTIMNENNKIFLLSTDHEEDIKYIKNIIFDVVTYIRTNLKQDSILVEYYNDNYFIEDIDFNTLHKRKNDLYILKLLSFDGPQTIRQNIIFTS